MRVVRLALAVLAGLAVLPLPAAAADGWTWPLPGEPQVVRGLGLAAEPWLPGHRGVDLAGRPGEVVRSAGAGVVSFAGSVAGVGVITIRHELGLDTTYQPVRPTVDAGTRVAAGDVIGRLGSEGAHCRPTCLHWGLRRAGDYLDPLSLLGVARVRLLPLRRDGDGHPVPTPAVATAVALGVAGLGVRRLSRAGRRACRAAAAPPWCASDRSGSR